MAYSDNTEDMGSIEDYLQPLDEGVWEVTIPRDLITEPPGGGWVISPINVPTPGTIASYRKGQYHMHETTSDFKVHLDRYDPSAHPILHLIDDAPLLLMISETFITLISFTRRSSLPPIAERLEQQTAILRHHLIFGTLIIILGTGFILAPDLTFGGITGLVIPGVVLLAGLLTLKGGISVKPPRVTDRDSVISGIWIIGVSVILGAIPPVLWAVCVLAIIAGWMFASSIMLLKRILHGKRAVPEGFISRLVIGTFSLLLGGFSLLAPVSVFHLFMNTLGVLTMTLGGAITLIGIRLREMMKQTHK